MTATFEMKPVPSYSGLRYYHGERIAAFYHLGEELRHDQDQTRFFACIQSYMRSLLSLFQGAKTDFAKGLVGIEQPRDEGMKRILSLTHSAPVSIPVEGRSRNWNLIFGDTTSFPEEWIVDTVASSNSCRRRIRLCLKKKKKKLRGSYARKSSRRTLRNFRANSSPYTSGAVGALHLPTHIVVISSNKYLDKLLCQPNE